VKTIKSVRAWRTLKGAERDVARQCEWFRQALNARCAEARGTAKSVSASLDFVESFVSNLRRGERTPDFKTACHVAWHFKTNIIDFLEEGRSLAEPEYKNGAKPPARLVAARQRLDALWHSGDRRTLALVEKLLEAVETSEAA